MGQTEKLVVRRFKILQILSLRRNGATFLELLEHVGCSRATLYRDIEFLETFLPVVRQTVGDTTKIGLLGSGQPVTLLVEEIAALRFARQMVQPLQGKWEVDAFDTLLRKLGRLSVPKQSQDNSESSIVKAIDVAIRDGKRVRFQYSSANEDSHTERTIDPMALRLHRSKIYCIGYDISRDDIRIYKLNRIRNTPERVGDSSPHPEFDEEKLFSNSSGIWAGDTEEVTILIQHHKARFVDEWPLTSSQRIHTLDNGDVLITAEVAGLQEPLKWLLSWGKAAKAMSPPEFVHLAKQEIDSMASEYSTPVST